jgi:hypothetical protein
MGGCLSSKPSAVSRQPAGSRQLSAVSFEIDADSMRSTSGGFLRERSKVLRLHEIQASREEDPHSSSELIADS